MRFQVTVCRRGEECLQVRSRVARVHVDYVDVRMGAATAYESKGRIYGGDIVTVRGQSGKPWIEVISGSVQGWIPSQQLFSLRQKMSQNRMERLTLVSIRDLRITLTIMTVAGAQKASFYWKW